MKLPKQSPIPTMLTALALGLAPQCTLTFAARAAGVDANSPTLPPPGSYVAPDDYHRYTSLGVVIDDPSHWGFTNVVRLIDGNDEIEQFDSQFDGTLLQYPSLTPLGPVHGQGPTTIRVTDRLLSPTGTFQTEMLSMSLSGTTPFGPAMIRESPTLQSLGVTTITDLGGGMYHIESFFDVFTEVSIDGGATWIPSDTSTRMTLVPEPSAWALVGLSLGACWLWRHRRLRTRG